MNNLSQADKRWSGEQLGTCDSETIGKSGCVITSIAMLAGTTPDVVNDLLRTRNGYANGCITKWDVAANLLGLPYDTERTKPVISPCIAETDNFKSRGYPQHFFVWLGNGNIIDPLDGKEKANPYHIVSYRNIGLAKGNDVTNEQAKLLIYVATQGHEPQGGERAFALGDISPVDLAKLRFRDDVISLGWRASNGDDCPESEKDYWQRAQQDHQTDHPVNSIGTTWFNDHVKAKLDAASAQIESQGETINAQTIDLADTHDKLQKMNDQITEAIQDKAKIAGDLLLAQEELKAAKAAAPSTMTAAEMIIEGIRKLLRITQ